LKSLTIPIHSEPACRENRYDKERYRAKTPRTHLTGKSLSRKGAKHVLREVEGGAKEKTEDEYSMED